MQATTNPIAHPLILMRLISGDPCSRFRFCRTVWSNFRVNAAEMPKLGKVKIFSTIHT